jgi:hypothetical protein
MNFALLHDRFTTVIMCEAGTQQKEHDRKSQRSSSGHGSSRFFLKGNLAFPSHQGGGMAKKLDPKGVAH